HAARRYACQQARPRWCGLEHYRHLPRRNTVAGRDNDHAGMVALPVPLARLMGYWWKFLSVALLLFASIAALRAPLAPALVHATPDRLATGTTAITITGYNTSFTSDHQVYLINSKERLCAGRVEIIAPNMIKATFNIASAPTEALSSTVVHHPEKGRLGLPEALFHPSTGS